MISDSLYLLDHEAAALMGMSPKTLANWRAANFGPPWSKPRPLDKKRVKRNVGTKTLHGSTRFLPIEPVRSRRIKVCKKPRLQRGMKNLFETHAEHVAIQLDRRGKPPLFALIDLADLPLVLKFPGKFFAMWCEESDTHYCIGHDVAGHKSVLLHRLIMGAKAGEEIDHCEHDGLDNRRGSLRIATRSQNALNRRGAREGSKSGVRGVYWHKARGKWFVSVRDNGIRRSLGGFATVGEATRAREDWIKRGR